MINFKEFSELSVFERCEIDGFIDKMCDYIPLEDIGDYIRVKRYIRKILEVIEKGDSDDEGRD